ncbi:hypothetical protein jhhlp_004920 [Lomentospora prolificans]|uniref:Pre-toxin TG domain-containing protein n=1 Tax=Lomentospora prolificans TaxID=41688 RepID=A0A2N3N812_9PEZI|nr:hypothetical protein jhhlp_004920 [Lomentospora prolificans]
MPFEEEVKKADLARLVRWSKNRLIEMMTDALTDTKAIAIQRETASILETDLNTNPKAVLLYFGGTGPIGHINKRLLQWHEMAENKARIKVSYETSSPAVYSLYIDKLVAFDTLLTRWALKEDNFLTWADNKFDGERTVWEASPQVPKLTKIIKDQAHEWFLRHQITPEFLQKSAIQIMDTFLYERPDMMVLVNLVLNFPKVKYIQQIEMKRAESEQLVELVLGCVPVLGGAIGLYEAWEGRDLAGYKLSNLERGVLAATVLLPAAGRLFKYGKAAYTEARLARMYGRSEAEWTRAIKASAQASEKQGALKTIQEGEEALLKTGTIDAKLAKELETVLPQLAQSAVPTTTVSPEVKAAWEALSQAYPALKVLDEFAIERIVQKGANESHIKGQLLEEIMEAHIIPWLRKREAGFALGVEVPEGKVLEYIPGHAIRSAMEKTPQQLTDGMVGYWDKEVFHVLGIFEAKAGKKGTRELLVGSKDLTVAQKQELRAFAKDTWRDERDIAKRLGKPYTRTVEQLVRLKDGGQLQRDIERLAVNEDGSLASVFIDGKTVSVHMSPKSTKFFGIVPKGKRIDVFEAQVTAAGYKFEAIAAPISNTDLNTATKRLAEIGAATIPKPP